MARKGGFGKMPGSMNNMLKQVQKMQKNMEKAQEELAEKEVEATAGGGAIKIVANGNKEIIKVEIKEEIVDPEDVEMLEDLVLTCVNQVLAQVDDLSKSAMSSVTGNINIPGLF